MNASNLYHTAYALLAQGMVWVLTGNLLAGAMAGTCFFFGREVAQYQASLATKGVYVTMKNPLELFKFWRWSCDSLLDVALPAIATLVVWRFA